MSDIASPRPSRLDLAWAAFAAANVVAMVRWESWETIPFHFIWVSLTLLYGFRVWLLRSTAAVLLCVCVTTGTLIVLDVSRGTQEWGELAEVPLMSAMFLAMVWHARRRQQAARALEALAESRARVLAQQEHFLHDISHELRTPMTIARGHLELMQWDQPDSQDLSVALDELARIERIMSRLLLIAKSDRPDFTSVGEVDVERFLEDVFVRWSDVVPRVWRLGRVAGGTVVADEETLRTALDALIENAVKYTDEHQSIELRARADGGELVLEVADGGCGIPPDAAERIFERFARVDNARNRAVGGAGLGLAIVAAIAKAHGGRCSARPLEHGALFSLAIPGFVATSRARTLTAFTDPA
jgi:signal transduction histidine kinase